MFGVTVILIRTKQKTAMRSPGKEDEYPIIRTFDETTFRVTITLKVNYKLDLTKSSFYQLVGFDQKVLTASSNVRTKVPNLSQDTNVINNQCDLAS